MCILDFIQRTNEVLPFGVQVGLVGQTALHDVGAVAGAGDDRGQAAAVRTIHQLHQGFHTLWTQRDLVMLTQAGQLTIIQ